MEKLPPVYIYHRRAARDTVDNFAKITTVLDLRFSKRKKNYILHMATIHIQTSDPRQEDLYERSRRYYMSDEIRHVLWVRQPKQSFTL